MIKPMIEADVLIIGAGVVGLTLAHALGAQGYRIVLLEQQSQPPLWNEEQRDLRVSAINMTSKKLFEDLGLWQLLAKKRVSAFREMKVWDENSTGRLHFFSEDIGRMELGYIIENAAMLSTLSETLSHEVKIFYGVELLKWQPKQLETSAAFFQADLILASDGAHSWMRLALSIGQQIHDYQQSALVAELQTENPHQKTAYQRFLQSGPLAFLPLSDEHRVSMVWSLPRDQAAQLQKETENIFLQRLEKSIEHLFGHLALKSSIALFPLCARHNNTYVKDAVIFFGDAAHTIHPLAGQGLNLGLADVKTFLTEVALYRSQGLSFDEMNWRPYERSRRAQNRLMQESMTWLNRLFMSSNKTIKWSRGVGLHAVNRLSLLKELFMEYA